MISVLIPSRNEFLLKKTIETTFAAAEGEIEIIAVLDGDRDIPKVDNDPRLTLIYHEEPIGQRAAVNEAAKLAKGKYILKTDAHSTFDKGFDVKLAADCEYDWTVIPRMYNLHAFDWVCENGHNFYQDKYNPFKVNQCPDCGKQLKIKYVWQIRRHKRTDFMYINNELKVKYWHAFGKRPEAKGKIVDIMNGIGACWFMHKKRFLDLGGLDEKHGIWGQVGVEVACKAWLSGGRHVVNKNTWFAHVFRTTGAYTFPYENPGSSQEKARRYSRNLWLNNKWPQQKRDFNWLINKFAPVPTWDGELKITDYFIEEMKVNDVYDNRMDYSEEQKKTAWLARYRKSHRNMDLKMSLMTSPDKAIENLYSSFSEFTRLVLGRKEFQLEETAYSKYLTAHLHPHDLMSGLTEKGKRRVRAKLNDAVKLIKDVRDNGIKSPLDMWQEKGKRILRKGYRRLIILHEIGVDKMPVRIWKDEETFYKNQTDRIPKKWRRKFAK